MATGSRASMSAWLLRATTLSVPSLAQAEGPAAVESESPVIAAEQHAAQAFEAYGQKRYADAIALYELAYATAPSADALFNIARVYDVGLGDRARAIAAYERCVAEPGASLERLERASERLVALRRAERAKLQAEPTGWAAAPLPAPSQPAPREPSAALRTAARMTGSAGVVGVGVGLGFGVAVLSDARTANAGCDGNRCSSERGVAAARSAATRATLATTGVSVGAALLVTAAVLWFLDGDEERDETPGVRFTPVAGAGQLGMAVGGGW